MEKLISQMFAGVLMVLAMAGPTLPDGRKRFLGIMNVDTAHSILRVPLIAATLYAASDQSDLKTTRKVLTGFGIFYLAMGTAGLIHRRVGGLLPSGLTNFDNVYHLTAGAAALWLGQRTGRMMKPEGDAS